MSLLEFYNRDEIPVPMSNMSNSDSSIRYMGYLTTRPSKRKLFRRYPGRIAWSNGAISPTLSQMFPLTLLPHLLPSETASTP